MKEEIDAVRSWILRVIDEFVSRSKGDIFDIYLPNRVQTLQFDSGLDINFSLVLFQDITPTGDEFKTQIAFNARNHKHHKSQIEAGFEFPRSSEETRPCTTGL